MQENQCARPSYEQEAADRQERVTQERKLESMENKIAERLANSGSSHVSQHQMETLEYMDPKYNYILPSIKSVISGIANNILRGNLEYLLNDYRRMWLRRHELEMQPEDGLLSEVKIWTDAQTCHEVTPLPDEELKTQDMNNDIDGQLEKLRDFQKNVAGIKDRFSKVSTEVLSQIPQEKDAFGFSFETALNRIQEMPSVNYTEADSVHELIKQIDTLKKLTEEQRLRLTYLFQAEGEVSEKVNEARKALSEADTFQANQGIHKCRLEKLKRDWLISQEKLFNELSSYAEPIVSQLKNYLCTEARESIIASESIIEYRRLLAAEKRYGNDNTPVSLKAQTAGLLLAPGMNPHLNKYITTALSSLKDSKDVCENFSKKVFERLSLEMKELQASTTNETMKATVDTEIESDLTKLRSKSIGKSSYHSSISSLFDVFSRMFSEYHRLFKIQRLRDLQMTTLLHNTNGASLTVARCSANLKLSSKFSLDSNFMPFQNQIDRHGKSVRLSKISLKPKGNAMKKDVGRKSAPGSKKNYKLVTNHIISGRAITQSAENRPRESTSNDYEKEKKKKVPCKRREQGFNLMLKNTFTVEDDEYRHDQRHTSFDNESISTSLLDCSEYLNDASHRNKVYQTQFESSVTPWGLKDD